MNYLTLTGVADTGHADEALAGVADTGHADETLAGVADIGHADETLAGVADIGQTLAGVAGPGSGIPDPRSPRSEIYHLCSNMAQKLDHIGTENIGSFWILGHFGTIL